MRMEGSQILVNKTNIEIRINAKNNSIEVKNNVLPLPTIDLLYVVNAAASIADSIPKAMPRYMEASTAETTSSIPGKISKPKMSSIHRKRRCVMIGSIIAVMVEVVARQSTPIDALASLTELKNVTH